MGSGEGGVHADLTLPRGGREEVSERPSAQVTHIKADLEGENRSTKDIQIIGERSKAYRGKEQ